ncbi:ISNCY family transposase [bacterium M00.F.Ca.ET.228.01.1.1]|uniref:ISNCY family transposase n=1 Tax=Paraburkholderia phenoliruptrix TaxID=252970 RepID=UPI001091B649|nr:ISNCY family transposase [Paraburkholderia phenoliruptrix]TGP39416.1 ISNCY family transposase [bacterium M00.F.Ca.ET.228.01.1.1]TGR95139.1 ISNCY family transposase [bacterium M00.F.Ca.ET.191.01.1.1]TGT95897.1 ISNCY family transposase [bacterium M00.F.Ca.ET.155.01.1.1]MBW0451292.1 ISNCY family transposase [Paraburkholderia phenoliruptrix]MBW9102022.1 ISNCY family transposase [Paraburkholderia phenoliruptrix]
MNEPGLVTISMNELRRVKIIESVVEGRLSGVRAAEQLGLSERQVSRLRRRFEAAGAAGLVSARRGRPSNRQFSMNLRARVLAIIRERYADFGPTLAGEKLYECHGIGLAKETVRQWMYDAGLWVPRAQRPPKVYQPRNRRACLGELIQIDGSDHRWFEDRAPACTLLVFIDDATSRLMTLHFTATESTFSYFEALSKYLVAHGKPVAFYSDKASVFYVKGRSETAGKGVTQFGRALYELNIETFCANTSQAKGRVERANLTLQDRLVKELRLRGISTQEAANAYAPSFIADFNRRFAKPPASGHNAHRGLREDEDLRQVLAYRVPRKVTHALTVQYDRVMYLLEDTLANRRLIHEYVEVVEYPNGSIEVQADGRVLPYREYDRITNIDQGAEVDNKRLASVLEVARCVQTIRDDRRAAGSPSRTHIGEAVRAKKALIGLKKQRAIDVGDINDAIREVSKKTIGERGAAAPPHPTDMKRNRTRTTAKPDISI